MSFAPAISFFAPDREFLPPRKKPIRRALPPPPSEEPQNSFRERLCQRLLAMDPILFMTGLLGIVAGAVIGLWNLMELVLPL
jgi:hypothetical protein